jgi:hypothetical protein
VVVMYSCIARMEMESVLLSVWRWLWMRNCSSSVFGVDVGGIIEFQGSLCKESGIVSIYLIGHGFRWRYVLQLGDFDSSNINLSLKHGD